MGVKRGPLLSSIRRKLILMLMQLFLAMIVVFMLTSCTLMQKQALLTIRWQDVSERIGVVKATAKHGSFGPMWVDLNDDGWLDLVFLNHGAPISLYVNQQGQRFLDRFSQSGIRTEPTYPEQLDRHGGACGDYNNDGRMDLIIAHGAKHGETFGIKYDELLRNIDGLTFEEVSHEAGVLNSFGRARTPTWVDFNNDGWLDLYIGNMVTPNVLYKNNGNGTFTDVTEEAGLGAVKGVRQAWADFDRDGWIDVLIVRPVSLYRNNGDGTFTDVTRAVGPNPYRPGEAMAIAWGDYDNDGYPDVFITSMRAGENILYHSNGDGTFSRYEGEFGPDADEKSMGAAWADVDNDGDLDLFVVSTKRLRWFENASGQFVEKEWPIELEPGMRGDLSFGDYDNDGDLDMAFASFSRQYLFRNDLNSGNNWLKLKFVGTASNRMGLGAKVLVETNTGKRIYREYRGDGGTLFTTGCAPLHVGLGKATATSITLEWPSGTRQRLESVRANQTLVVREP